MFSLCWRVLTAAHGNDSRVTGKGLRRTNLCRNKRRKNTITRKVARRMLIGQ